MTLRLASYNIRKAVGLDYRRDPGRIVDIVNGLAADVVALQEVDRRLGDRPTVIDRRLLDTDTDFRPVDVSVNDASLGWHGNALLVRKGLDIRNTGRIALPGLEPRGAVFAEVTKGDDSLTVVGTHLGLLRPWRRLQLLRIRKRLERAGKLPDAAVLGDFNEWSNALGLEALQGMDIISPGKSFHAARQLASLDRVALGEGLEFLDAGVEEGPSARVASDHLPIWTDIRVRDR